jgi:hypothetical protein
VQEARKESERLLPWQILGELRNHTGFANWSQNTDGWGALEEHRDPSRCAGVTVESGKITKISLSFSNLVGGESPHLINHVSRTTSCPSMSGTDPYFSPSRFDRTAAEPHGAPVVRECDRR